MNDTPFYKTVMGHRFFERDVPALLAHLEKLVRNLERIASALEKVVTPPPESGK